MKPFVVVRLESFTIWSAIKSIDTLKLSFSCELFVMKSIFYWGSYSCIKSSSSINENLKIYFCGFSSVSRCLWSLVFMPRVSSALYMPFGKQQQNSWEMSLSLLFIYKNNNNNDNFSSQFCELCNIAIHRGAQSWSNQVYTFRSSSSFSLPIYKLLQTMSKYEKYNHRKSSVERADDAHFLKFNRRNRF